MLLSKLATYLGLADQVKTDVEITGLSNDSRRIKEGYLFIAVTGEKNDGKAFIAQAIAAGAVAVLSDSDTDVSVPVLKVADVRLTAARLAAFFYSSDQMMKVAVTGTNGKTSTVFYVQQIMNAAGILSASLGTVGVASPVFRQDGSMTTPDSIQLNQTLQTLSEKGVWVTALEASSHGLDQGRLEGLCFQAAAFTNLTLDHLDYHKTMEQYFEAKKKLFSTYLKKDGTAVLNADIPEYAALKEICDKQGIRILSYGIKGADLTIISQKLVPTGQDVVLRLLGTTYAIHLNILGDFQLMNFLAAVGLCLGAGLTIDRIMEIAPTLQAPTGRMEAVCRLENGAQIFVDYAHTPDALSRVLTSLKAHVAGRLICLFGCGGNRDTSKRPQMGQIAEQTADVVYITDDNPRFEDPAAIRAQIAAACPKGIVIDNRSRAVFEAVSSLKENDVLVLAGKGHESGQTIQGVSFAYNDAVEAKLAALSQDKLPLWSAGELSLALSVPVALEIAVFGISRDTRTLCIGDLFVALKGEQTDGHRFVYEAVHRGAAACLVDHVVEAVPLNKQIVVPDTMAALDALARYARMRSDAVFIGITGSSGKTTTKEMLKACLSRQGLTHATEGNYNNQLGVPLTLVQMPRETQFAIIEMGMNHFGELMYLSDLVRPQVSVITTVGAAHRAYFKSDADIATAKSEIFEFQDINGTALLNKENPFFDQVAAAAHQHGIKHVISFGERGDIFAVCERICGDKTFVEACVRGQNVTYNLNYLGHHFVLDSLAVLGAVEAAGASVPAAASVLETVFPMSGRGAKEIITLPDGEEVVLIDDAYNANPASMKASLKTLGLMPCAGRRIAVLGDMLELGETALDIHLDLRQTLLTQQIDQVFVTGELMGALFKTLPTALQGAAVSSAGDLIPILKRELRPNDVVLVKASHGSGLTAVVQGLKGV